MPLERLTVIGHSMGGLLARSAIATGRNLGLRWPGRVQDLVFLGTPQHGAPLERAGHGAERLLASNPFTAPFARLGEDPQRRHHRPASPRRPHPAPGGAARTPAHRPPGTAVQPVGGRTVAGLAGQARPPDRPA